MARRTRAHKKRSLSKRRYKRTHKKARRRTKAKKSRRMRKKTTRRRTSNKMPKLAKMLRDAIRKAGGAVI
jgi:hypothetical protein